MIQWLLSNINSQRNKSMLHRLSFICPRKLSQDGPSVPASAATSSEKASILIRWSVQEIRRIAIKLALRAHPTRPGHRVVTLATRSPG
jgi:hypothetical protein